jgi:hypothetical protein
MNEPTGSDQTEYLTEQCRAAWASHAEKLSKAATLRNALQATLTPAAWDQVMELVDVEGQTDYAFERAVMREVARHVPAFAPILPMIWEHCNDLSPRNHARCCVTTDQER